MKIIAYLGHPAQYHFLKNIVSSLLGHGHSVSYLIRKKDVLEQLLAEAGEPYVNILPEGRKANRIGIIAALIKREIRLYPIIRHQRPDLLIGSDAALAHLGRLLNIPVLTVLEDDYRVVTNLARLTFPFTSAILAPEPCNCGRWNKKKISYAGYMKLAYLHPVYFSTRIAGRAQFILIRTSKLDAHHDAGIKGLHTQLVRKIVAMLGNNERVRITSEGEIPPDLKHCELNIRASEIHQHLAGATMLISDSQSMTMEAAMLGVPSIRFSDLAGRIGVLEELENKYGLTFGIKTSEPERLFQKIHELLGIPDLRQEWQRRREKMLSDKIDVTAFFVWFIENYPESYRIMKANPHYQYRFKRAHPSD